MMYLLTLLKYKVINIYPHSMTQKNYILQLLLLSNIKKKKIKTKQKLMEYFGAFKRNTITLLMLFMHLQTD